MDQTLSLVAESSEAITPRGFLTIAFHASRPRDLPLRVDLDAFDRVVIGRGAARRVQHEPARQLRVELDEPTLSRAHVAIERVEGRWTAIDQGSKNGTLVDHVRVDRSALSDGAIIGTGAVFSVFRLAAVGVCPPLRDGHALVDEAAGLRTVHPALEEQLDRLRRAATSDLPVLVFGETGTGKELVARAIHELSGRGGRFVAINCGAVAETLMASELFGVRRGAFSGANTDRVGLFRAADGGTLLLDEIGEMPEQAQVALLRVLQERQVLPVGETTPVDIDVRVIAATHRDLRLMVQLKSFRDDLLGRLAGVIVHLLPLRERREDLAFMVARSLDENHAPDHVSFSVEAAASLFARPWRRNGRELHQVLSAALATGVTRIERAHLSGLDDEPPEPTPGPRAAVSPEPAAQAAEEPTAEQPADAASLEALLDAHGGNLSAVARALSTSRTQVARLMERFGVTRPRRPI
jgi:DNA-binding NtrC family response regulator